MKAAQPAAIVFVQLRCRQVERQLVRGNYLMTCHTGNSKVLQLVMCQGEAQVIHALISMTRCHTGSDGECALPLIRCRETFKTAKTGLWVIGLVADRSWRVDGQPSHSHINLLQLRWRACTCPCQWLLRQRTKQAGPWKTLGFILKQVFNSAMQQRTIAALPNGRVLMVGDQEGDHAATPHLAVVTAFGSFSSGLSCGIRPRCSCISILLKRTPCFEWRLQFPAEQIHPSA